MCFSAEKDYVVVAGGMESMTNAPYLLPKARAGLRMGHGQVIDHMFYDGLEDAYEKGRLMGTFAEECARNYQFSRQAQDEFAIASLKRAQAANKDGSFAWETTPLAIKAGKDEKFIEIDEQPFKANLDKIPTLKPAFAKEGTVTAANSSSISDGAAALVMMRRSAAEKRGLAPLAMVVGHSTHAQEPGLFTTAPVGAIRKLFERTGWTRGQGRPLRDQRGLRRGDHGGDEGARPAARQGQRARRRLRPRPSDRRLGRAHRGHAARRAAQARAEARRGEPVHRRRRGHGHGAGAGLKATKAHLQKMLDRSRFIRHYGFQVAKVDATPARSSCRIKPLLERPGGIVNGPALMAAADCAMWMAIKAKLGVEYDALTSELNTAFLAPAKGEHVYCTARILKLGRRRIYGTAECHAKNGKLFSHHTVTYVRPE